MTKKDRQKVVLDLINEFEIDTQEELTAKLNERGIEVTQATISRDINELNLIKIAGKAKKYKYAQIDIKNAALSEKIGFPVQGNSRIHYLREQPHRRKDFERKRAGRGNGNRQDEHSAGARIDRGRRYAAHRNEEQYRRGHHDQKLKEMMG